MPRVVPSQIVALIDRVLSDLLALGPGPKLLTQLQAPKIAAVIELASELPDAFLTLGTDEYSDYRVGINALKDLVNLWQNAPAAPSVNRQAMIGTQSLNDIRSLLAKCPDEAPSPSTVELSFITDLPLRESIRNDISAATRALHDGLWKAATVLAGAATEALLLWAIRDRKSASEIEKARSGVIPQARPDPNDWSLDGYIKVARALALIEEETEKQADLAKDFRNLIHPGRSARLTKVCDHGTALSALAAVAFVVRDVS
jgi:hypothetical protein